MSEILSTIVVRFGDSVSESEAAGFSSVIALDDILNGNGPDGKPKRTFYEGESAFVTAHLQPGFYLSRVEYTSGEAQNLGLVTRSYTQEKLFFVTPEEAANLSHYPTSLPSAVWYGNSSGLSLKDDELLAAGAPCIGDITYSFVANSLLIIPPATSLGEDDTWPLGIVLWVDK